MARAVAILTAFFLSLANAEAGTKTALVFNGGGALGEGQKNANMEKESAAAIAKLKAAGYSVDGNVFVRDGAPRDAFDGVANQKADAAAFLARLKTVCDQSKAGDEVVVSFAGHGLRENGTPVDENEFHGYDGGIPRVTMPDDAAAMAALRAPVKAYLDSVKAQIKTRGQEGVGADVTAATEIAHALGVSGDFVSSFLQTLVQRERVDLMLNVDDAMVKKVSDALRYAKEHADQPPPAILKGFFATGDDLSMKELKPVVDACAAKGARVRMSSTNCYGAGLLGLTDDKGLICAVAMTNPYTTAVVSDGFFNNGQAGAGSLADMRDSARSAPQSTNTFINNDPVSSSDGVIADWVDRLRSGCSESGGDLCLGGDDKSRVCGAMKGAPGYYRADSSGRDADAVPAAMLALFDGQVPQKQNVTLTDGGSQVIRPEVRAQSDAMVALLKAGGYDIFAPSIETEDDLLTGARAFVDQLAASKEKSKQFREAFGAIAFMGVAANEGIGEDGTMKDAGRVANAVFRWASAWRAGREVQQMADGATDVEYRKTVYKALFDRFATTGSCQQRMKNAQKCESSPIDGSGSGSAHGSAADAKTMGQKKNSNGNRQVH